MNKIDKTNTIISFMLSSFWLSLTSIGLSHRQIKQIGEGKNKTKHLYNVLVV